MRHYIHDFILKQKKLLLLSLSRQVILESMFKFRNKVFLLEESLRNADPLAYLASVDQLLVHQQVELLEGRNF